MKRLRQAAAIATGVLFAVSLAADLAPASWYSRQYRDSVDALPSLRFPLGTDALGRDRAMRLLHATGISIALAASAALAATVVATLAGGIAGYCGGWCDALVARMAALMVSVPWFFLLLAARAVLPLNISPVESLVATYAIIALLGWASPAIVVRAGARQLCHADFALQARACGSGGLRLLWRHIVPNLKPVLLAQFMTSIPVFILAEANLGMLGLSAAEPYPTWGNLLEELRTTPGLRPESLAPLALVALSVCCFRLIFPLEHSRV